MRKLLLITAAGLAATAASAWGFLGWWRAPSAHGSLLFALVCLLPALSFPAFVVYLRWPRLGVTLTWLLLSGSWFAAFLMRLRVCRHQTCTAVDSLHIAAQTITGEPHLWPLLIAAVCLLFAYTESLSRTPPVFGAITHHSPDE